MDMKTILNRIDKLTRDIENGKYTRSEAFAALKDLRSTLICKFEPGTDKFMICIEALVDTNECAKML